MSYAIGSLGDSALLLPASLALALYLLAMRHGRFLLAWLAALAACGTATIGFKLAFHACGRAITNFDVVSPSGHASFGLLFYGAVAAMLSGGRTRLVRIALAGGAAALVLLIGASRVRTGAHSPEEVVIGLALGAAGLLLFLLLRPRTEQPKLPIAPIVVGFALTLVLLGGRHFTLETTIGSLAKRMADAVDVCGPRGK